MPTPPVPLQPPRTHSAGGLPCPVCRVDLVMADRQGIEIDYCPKCRGIWLDRGELDKIIELSLRQPRDRDDIDRSFPASPAPRYAPDPRSNSGYGDGDRHGGGHGSGHGGRHGGGHGGGGHGSDWSGGHHGGRRRSWLRDLFD